MSSLRLGPGWAGPSVILCQNGRSAPLSAKASFVGEHAETMLDERVGVSDSCFADTIAGHRRAADYTQPMADAPAVRRGPEPPDLAEKGGMKDGQPQRSHDRLFMQLLAFGGCGDPRPLGEAVARANVAGVLYEDVNDPRGIALLTLSQDPAFFVDRVRPLLNAAPVGSLAQKP